MMNSATRIGSRPAAGGGRARLEPADVLRRADQRPQRLEIAGEETAARAWTSTLPSAVASTGPAMTGSSHASAVSWHNSVLRAPPPTRWTTSTGRPDSRVASRKGGA